MAAESGSFRECNGRATRMKILDSDDELGTTKDVTTPDVIELVEAPNKVESDPSQVSPTQVNEDHIGKSNKATTAKVKNAKDVPRVLDRSGQGSPSRRYHVKLAPSGERIVPYRKENRAPRIVVPRPNAEDPNEELGEYQYKSKELHTLPMSDDEDGPTVFPQHNPDGLDVGKKFAIMS
ncbi:hypothetical protein PIB30_082525 [Stylosanthes scabra]|uniref:Uncharacterized protein n=1 Tax=Stylosanthes scabra TaxID=79078 RepID=A0ABU6WQA0_9FABA|nr:hypothetical protein [Stylosanthes scabra]